MERDQHKNRELAMTSLRAKLYEMELASMVKEEKLNRKLQVFDKSFQLFPLAPPLKVN